MPGALVYREEHPSAGWILSVATYAPPHSGKASLGGFRIVPPELADEPGYDNDRQAIGLAVGMEGKIRWSRIARVGGPLAQRNIERLVGGKVVLCPSANARVGQPRDGEMLRWAGECLRAIESSHGFHIVTGQDLGHGLMHDGRTQSLDFLHTQFPGSMVSDTSKPTGEGNFQVLKGMLAAFGLPLKGTPIGLIGCGHIGTYVLDRAKSEGAEVVALEANPERRAVLLERGVRVFPPEAKDDFLAMALDAVVVNANKRSLDEEAVSRIIENRRIRVICGSENEAMPNPADADRLRAARKVYIPTEFGGMMGYLTAVEEYYHQLEGTPFHIETMLEAARPLEGIAQRITKAIIDSGFALSFAEGCRDAGM